MAKSDIPNYYDKKRKYAKAFPLWMKAAAERRDKAHRIARGCMEKCSSVEAASSCLERDCLAAGRWRNLLRRAAYPGAIKCKRPSGVGESLLGTVRDASGSDARAIDHRYSDTAERVSVCCVQNRSLYATSGQENGEAC